MMGKRKTEEPREVVSREEAPWLYDENVFFWVDEFEGDLPWGVLGKCTPGIGGEVIEFFQCATEELAEEVECALTLIWQTAMFGRPDPELKANFKAWYGENGWGAQDVQHVMAMLIQHGFCPAPVSMEVH